MNKHLLLLLAYFLIYTTKAQVVFCPPGAEWTYNFTYIFGGAPLPKTSLPEKIKYVRDSIVNFELVKVLTHKRFHLDCSEFVDLTLIKQVGDTIYMRNRATYHNWEILYVFNAQVGQSWETMINSGDNNSTPYIYTVTVNSISSVIENGFNLKHMSVKYKIIMGSNNFVLEYSDIITERFGCSTFLFNYYNNTYGSCDFEKFQRFLCYKDNQFGTKQFTSFPCDYNNLVSINEQQKENESVKIYPNPASDFLTVDNSAPLQFLQAEILDMTGKSFIKQDCTKNPVIDVRDLTNGVYFLNLYPQDKFLDSKKLVIIK